MEKDIGSVPKKEDTKILVRIDDFGGKRGLTIREYVENERYTGFTKAGTRIPAEQFEKFKEIINSINPEDLKTEGEEQKQIDWDAEEKKHDEEESARESVEESEDKE